MESSLIEIRVDNVCDDTFATIAHEAAHTWFHGNDPADWIDEGLANAMEAQVVSANQSDEIAYPPVTYCRNYVNINELELDNPFRESNDPYTDFRCNYSLGDGIFGALREYYGDSEFNQRIAQLARRSTNTTKQEHTIADIRKTLGDDGPAIEIVNLWYEGQPEMRKYRHQDAVAWTLPPTIDGEYLHFHGVTDIPELVHDFGIGEDPYCSQFVLREGIGKEEWVNNVSRPLPAGRTHHEGSRVITINHEIDPDTGSFQVTAKILGNALSGIRDLSLSVNERVIVGADRVCDESINYSQVPVVTGKIPTELKVAQYFHLDAVEWTFLPTIDGDYLHFAGKTREPGLVHNFVLGNDSYCSQFSLYRNVINQDLVATIRDPLLVGWSSNDVPEVIVVNDNINPATGEFSVTALINDHRVLEIPELSLLVESRIEVGDDELCAQGDTYSQVRVSVGEIPSELKIAKHYHQDAIEWIGTPTIKGDLLTLQGMVEVGVINLQWRNEYCGQMSLFERDERGYHRIASIASLLPDNRKWSNPQAAELVEGWTYTDGKFKATARLSSDLLLRHGALILVVRTATTVDKTTQLCGDSEVLSAVDIHRN